LDNASDQPPTLPTNAVLERSEHVLGVAAARNRAGARVTTPLLVFLDDDAAFAAGDALRRVLQVFDAEPRVGAIALNSLAVQADGAELEQMRLARGVRYGIAPIPCGQESTLPVAVFVGAGCAFRVEALRGVGGFREDFQYGGEEFHLSLRLIDQGWELRYLPGVKVFHYHSGVWRLDASVRLPSQLRNKWAMAAEILPRRHIPGALGPFTLHMLAEMRRNGVSWAGPLRWACRSFLAEWRHRRPLSLATVRTAARLRGRL
jgi:GT2 family glycosyltransferase